MVISSSFFHIKSLEAVLILYDPARFYSQAPGLPVALGSVQPVSRGGMGGGGDRTQFQSLAASLFSSVVKITNGKMFSFTRIIVFFPPL